MRTHLICGPGYRNFFYPLSREVVSHCDIFISCMRSLVQEISIFFLSDVPLCTLAILRCPLYRGLCFCFRVFLAEGFGSFQLCWLCVIQHDVHVTPCTHTLSHSVTLCVSLSLTGSLAGYYFMPNAMANLQAQQNAAAAVAAASQGLYGMADNWSHLPL